MRPSWDEYWLRVAELVATRGTCFRRKVGCVITDADHAILATGYNGVASGLPHCDDVTFGRVCTASTAKSGMDLDFCDAIHGEQNALARCADKRHMTTCYVTVSPCVSCVKLLMGTNLCRIVFREEYERHHDRARDLWLDSKPGPGAAFGHREWIQL